MAGAPSVSPLAVWVLAPSRGSASPRCCCRPWGGVALSSLRLASCSLRCFVVSVCLFVLALSGLVVSPSGAVAVFCALSALPCASSCSRWCSCGRSVGVAAVFGRAAVLGRLSAFLSLLSFSFWCAALFVWVRFRSVRCRAAVLRASLRRVAAVCTAGAAWRTGGPRLVCRALVVVHVLLCRLRADCSCVGGVCACGSRFGGLLLCRGPARVARVCDCGVLCPGGRAPWGRGRRRAVTRVVSCWRASCVVAALPLAAGGGVFRSWVRSGGWASAFLVTDGCAWRADRHGAARVSCLVAAVRRFWLGGRS